MRTMKIVIAVLLPLVLIFLLVLFIVQNMARTTDLSLDLRFFAWHLANPLPVVHLLLGCLAGGLLVGAVVGYVKGRQQRASNTSFSGSSSETGGTWT